MKRSKINECIKEMEKLVKENGFHLPPFCDFTPEGWKTKGHEYDEIRDNMLGWDITDYGLNDWDKVGFALITLRNGNQNNPKYKKVYAEKLLMLKEGQHSPMHFHWNKSEDIINRGGGTLIIHVYNDDGNEQLDGTEVSVNSDGRTYLVPAGAGVELKPGESITLWPHQFHDFDVKPGTGDVLMVKFLCAMMIIQIIVLIHLSEDFQKLKRMRNHIVYCVMNIQRQCSLEEY